MTSKITDVEIRNVMRLKYVHVQPDGSLTVVGGDNGNGKTSFLQSIAMALGGAKLCPPSPIREGESYAEVKLDLSESTDLPPCTVIRQWIRRPDGSVQTKLDIVSKVPDITEAEGANPFGYAKAGSPQGLLNSLIDHISFDPLSFLAKDEKEQAELLRKLVGLNLVPFDAEIKKLYDERTAVNKALKESAALAHTMPTFPDAPQEELDIQSLHTELEKAINSQKQSHQEIAALDAVCAKVKTVRALHESLSQRKDFLEKELAKVQKELADLNLEAMEIAAAEAEQKKAQVVIPDIRECQTRVQLAEKLNQNIRAHQAFLAEKQKCEKHLLKTKELTEAIDALRDKKLDMISKAPWPIAGLGFDPDGGAVLYNGLPLAQASSRDKIRVGVAMASKLNAGIKIALVEHGSLLDAEGLALLADESAKHGIQVFLERVGQGPECNFVMVDGEVADHGDSVERRGNTEGTTGEDAANPGAASG